VPPATPAQPIVVTEGVLEPSGADVTWSR